MLAACLAKGCFVPESAVPHTGYVCPLLAVSGHPIIQLNNTAGICFRGGRPRNDSRFWLRAGKRRIQPARPVLDLPGLQALFGQMSPGRGQHGKRGDGMEGIGVHAVYIQMVEQPGQGPVRMRAVDQAKFVSGRDHTRFQHAVIPAGASAGLDAPGHVRDAERTPSFQQGWRACATWMRAVPRLNWSPTQTFCSVRPTVEMFSPNPPVRKRSARSGSSRHQAA